MTSVRIVKSKVTGYKSFEVFGHSGYSEEGSDIVCASISTSTELTIGILEKFSVDTRLDIREDTAYVLCEIAETEYNAAKKLEITNVLGGFAEYIKDVSCVYPEYLKCVITQE